MIPPGSHLFARLTISVLIFSAVQTYSSEAQANRLRDICSQGFSKIAQTLDERSYPIRLQDGHFRPYFQPELNLSSRNYNRAWTLTAVEDLNQNRKSIEKALQDGDPQMDFLKFLGFEIDFANGHKVPSMSEIEKRYGEKMNELVAAGKIQPHEVLKPARMFATKIDGKQQIIAVGLTAEPPPGAIPVEGGLHGERFLRFVADGYWPMGEMAKGQPSNSSFAFHDLGHFGAFTRDPEFMAAIRQFAETRVRESRFKIREELTNHIFENLTVANPEKRAEFQKQLASLGLESNQGRDAWDVSRYSVALGKLEPHLIQEEVKKAYTLRHEMVTDVGGIRSDGISKQRVRDPGYRGGDRATLENPKEFLEKAYEATTTDDRRKYYARYLAAMDHTTRFSPAEWVRELTPRDHVRTSSPIYNYLCRSRLFFAGHAFYAFCHSP